MRILLVRSYCWFVGCGWWSQVWRENVFGCAVDEVASLFGPCPVALDVIMAGSADGHECLDVAKVASAPALVVDLGGAVAAAVTLDDALALRVSREKLGAGFAVGHLGLVGHG